MLVYIGGREICYSVFSICCSIFVHVNYLVQIRIFSLTDKHAHCTVLIVTFV